MQIQSLKSHIENMKLQIDNIEMQISNSMMVNYSIISEQVLNISIQMFNAGIQAFNTGKNMNMMMNLQNFYNQIRTISEQLNLILNENIIQQFLQQPMMQQQMQPPQLLIPQDTMVLKFENAKGMKTVINIDFESTVEEALNRFIKKTYGSSINKKLIFMYNAKEIKMNEQMKIRDFFNGSNFASIEVVEI